jgi:hypothetical protein
MAKRRAKRLAVQAAQEAEANSFVAPIDEQFAAIAAAIFMYNSELHDEENAIMTINKVARAYSPWNSKIYFQNQYFNRR